MVNDMTTQMTIVRRSNSKPPSWHAVAADEILRELGSSPEGLATAEATRRLRAEGLNRLPEGAKRSALARFLLQFHNVLIYVLLASAVVSFLLGHAVDAAVILGVVLANATIGFVQEGKAEQALTAIKNMIDPRCSVMRDGHRLTIPAEQVVRGDVVLIETGDRVPADLRLLRARSLKIDEAILTGESVPVEKSFTPVAIDAPLGDRSSMAFSGTFVAAGQGAGIVVGTAARSELGRISALLGAVETLKTPLVRQMDSFAQQLTVVILAVSAAAFAYAYFVGGYLMSDAPRGGARCLASELAIGLRLGRVPRGTERRCTNTCLIVRRLDRVVVCWTADAEPVASGA
jgi:magnesium-transporting ATPase (P-type)